MPMVQYWKFKESVDAIVTLNKEGSVVMRMNGETEDFPGFPRGSLLFGQFSKLKHEIKNRIFNDSWKLLEEGKDPILHIKKELESILDFAETMKYDMVPPGKMCKSVKEIYRAWTKVSPETSKLRDLVTFVLQEDDGYRFRLQWAAGYFRWWAKPLVSFARGLAMLERGEVINDMKERQRLFKRVLMAYAEHSKTFESFFREVDWKKVRLGKADLYHFRGKYFKVDLELFDY